jgi:hypothetical protein
LDIILSTISVFLGRGGGGALQPSSSQTSGAPMLVAPHTVSHGCNVPSHLCDCWCHLSVNLMQSRSQQHLCYRHLCGNGSGNVWKHTQTETQNTVFPWM